MRSRQCVVVVAATVLVAAPAAFGGRAETAVAPSASVESSSLIYNAAPAEVNELVIGRSAVSSGQTLYTLTDSAGIVAGDGCVQVDAGSARCATVNETEAGIDLGDGDDRLSLKGASAQDVGVEISDGAGNDVVAASASGDVLDNGPGDDVLRGGAGEDELEAGAGDDALSGGGGDDRLADDRGRDRFAGGPGDDRIDARDRSRSARTVPDRVDCGPGSADVAIVDRRDRVAGNCERVRRR